MIYTYLEPIHKFLGYITSDPEWERRYAFKGGRSAGSSYYAKWALYQLQKYQLKAEEIQRQMNGGTTLYDIVSQNILRLSALAGVERVITLQQGLVFNKNKFLVNEGFSGALKATFNQGVFRGYFKGYFAYLTGFLGVSYNSLLWLKKADYTSHLLLSTFFETVFYPVDSMKTLMNNDVKGVFKGYTDCVSKVLATEGMNGLYKGITFKLAHNAIFIANLRCLYDNDYKMYFSMPIWMFSYFLLSFKTKAQMIGSPLSNIKIGADMKEGYNQAKEMMKYNARSVYSGFIAYTLVNILFAYNFYALYSDQAYNNITSEYSEKIDKKLESKYERYFS